MKHVLFVIFAITWFPPSSAIAQDAESQANQAYRYQQEQQQQEQMKTYQNNAGNYNPGPTTAPLGNNTYIAPSYQNGSAGVTVTHTYK